MKSFECHGIWWLPSDPSDKMGGTLSFSDDSGIVLHLFGAFGEPAYTAGNKAMPIVVGITWDSSLGSLFTLKNCRLTSFHLGSPGIAREDYLCENLFIGAHLEEEDDFLFSYATLEFSGLSNWAEGLSGLTTGPVTTNDPRARGYFAQWTKPDPLVGNIAGARLVLGAGAKSSATVRKATIEEKIQIVVETKQLLTCGQLIVQYSYPLQNFLTFATGNPSTVSRLRVRRTERGDPIDYLAARVYAGDDADVPAHRMLFTLQDVRERAMELFARWIDLSSRLVNALTPFFAVQYQPKTYVDIKFLSVFQALELYALASHREQVIEPSIVVSGRLSEAIRRLLEDHWAEIGPLFPEGLQVATNEIISFRNFVVHRSSDLDSAESFGSRLFWLTQAMVFLMNACLLQELGFSVDERVRLIRRNPLFDHIVGQRGSGEFR